MVAAALEAQGVAAKQLGLIKSAQSSILIQQVKSKGALAALAGVAFQFVFIRQVHGAVGRRVVCSDILLPAAVPHSCRAPSAHHLTPYFRPILRAAIPLAY